MKSLFALILTVVITAILTAVAGFVIASVKAYDFDFMAALPIGAILGLAIYIFSHLITPGPQSEQTE